MAELVWLKKYPAAVPHSVTVPEAPLFEILDEAAAKYPSATATVFYGAKVSYAELREAACRLAGLLTRLGIEPGSRVGLLMPNLPSFVIGYFGALRAGCIVVPLNPMLAPAELSFQITDSGTATLIVAEPLVDKLEGILPNTPVKHVFVTRPARYVPLVLRPIFAARTRPKTKLHTSPGLTVLDLEQILRDVPPLVRGTEVQPKTQPAVLQYTGGTTGVSKAAVLTHYNLVANLTQVRAWLYQLRECQEVFLSVLPFFHSYGMTVGMNLAVALGATMVMLPRFDPGETTRAIHKHKVTLMPGVPSMYLAVARCIERNRLDISSVKVCVSGGAPLPREIHDRFVAVTNAKLVEGYGLTETAPVTHVNPIWDGENRIGTIGLPIPSTECRIVDLADGTRDLPPGTEGELLIRGPQVMSGYWNRPDETAQALRNGWLHTGDIAVLEPDGYFRIVDRKKDMIIVGGFNVYPREVEEVLFKHPKVEEAAVVGEHSVLRGETVKAYVVLKPGVTAQPSEIIAFCREHLAPYKVPRTVEFVEQLPKSAVGKVLRRNLHKTGEQPG